jgi:ketosteroid isomerase-like protein
VFARRVILILLCVTWAASAIAAGESLGPGERIPDLELEDQFGVSHAVGPEVRLVLYSRDMKSGKVIEKALEDTDSSYLGARGAVVVADIHRMPGLITTLFALPKLRDRPYPMLLDRDGAPTEALPFREGEVTWLALDEGIIREIRHVDAAEVLRSELDREVVRSGAAAGGPESEVREIESRRYAAMQEADIGALEPLLADDLVYTHSSGAVQSKQELLDALGSGELRYLDVQMESASLRVYGETVVVTGVSRVEVAAGARQLDLALRITAVYVRRDGDWELVAYQSTSLSQ